MSSAKAYQFSQGRKRARVQRELIDELGKLPYTRMITPLKTMRLSQASIVGFDTEYVSKTQEFLSCQLSYGDGQHTAFHTEKMTVDRLAKWVRSLGVDTSEAILVSYFSLAELQFLPVKEDSFNWREYGSSFDCTFRSVRHALDIRVFDLARFFERQSLESVALAFGFEKKKWARDKVTKADLNKKGFREYAVHDAVITEQIFNALRSQFLERSVDIAITETAARSTADAFRHEYVSEALENRNNRARYAALRAVWGGRAEAFRRGSFARLYEYDISSAYPQAAIGYGRLPETKNWSEFSSLKTKATGGCCYIKFAFPRGETYPCLPVITKGCMLYPLTGQEWVTLDEARYAKELGCKIDVIEGWGFKGGSTALPDFLSTVLAERAVATGAKKAMLKLLSNSLIGKLAQRTAKLDIEKLWRTHVATGIDIEDLLRLTPEAAAEFGLKVTYSVGSCYMPEWNMLITGRTRTAISRLVREHSAVYCATDAIWTEKRLKSAPEGTLLKRQGSGYVARTRLGFLGDHTVHHSIIKKTVAREMMEAGELRREYEFARPLKLRESLRNDKVVGRWITDWRTASLAWDEKRQLFPDGSTAPWKSVVEYEAARKNAKQKVTNANDIQDFFGGD